MHHPTDRIAHTMAFVAPVVQWLLIKKSSPCGGSRFPLSRYPSGPLPYVRCHITVNKNVLSASLNKTFPSFLRSCVRHLSVFVELVGGGRVGHVALHTLHLGRRRRHSGPPALRRHLRLVRRSVVLRRGRLHQVRLGLAARQSGLLGTQPAQVARAVALSLAALLLGTQ